MIFVCCNNKVVCSASDWRCGNGKAKPQEYACDNVLTSLSKVCIKKALFLANDIYIEDHVTAS
jgi:hypothetical protein